MEERETGRDIGRATEGETEGERKGVCVCAVVPSEGPDLAGFTE